MLICFNYNPSEKFVKALYKIRNTEIVFLAIETSLLANLHYSNKNYFKISALHDIEINLFYFVYAIKASKYFYLLF
nr:DUF5960 family protein [Enterococcus ratti]